MKFNNINVYEHNRKILLDHIDIHTDDFNVLDISIKELISVGVGVIKKISFNEDNAYNWVMIIENNTEQIFYFGRNS